MSHTKLSFTIVCCCLGSSLAARAESAPYPRITVSSVQVTEGNSGKTPFTVQVGLPYYLGTSVTVRVTATPGTADESDYVFSTTELTLSGSGPAQTVTGYIVGDTNPEDNEYFSLSATVVGTSTSMYLVPGYGTVTIVDDDQALASRLHVEGATVVEGNHGTTNAEVRVRLEPASTNTVTVAYQTTDVTAAAGADYQAASGTLTFAPGEVLKTLLIPIIGDTLPEFDESFAVVLASPTMALLGTSRAEVVITNDDPVVRATIADLTVDEGNDGVKAVPITITFDHPVPDGSKVQVRTVGAGAIADQDFRALSQTLYPPAGATQMTFDLEVLSDTLPECDEGLFIHYNTVHMGEDVVKMARVILRNDDSPVAGCNDPFVPSPSPEPPTDGGVVLPPPVEPRTVDGGAGEAGLDTGSPLSTPPEPRASDAGVTSGSPDTGALPDLASAATPGQTSDAQLLPDVQAPSSFGDSGSANPGSDPLGTQRGCSCSLGEGARAARLPWLALVGLLALLARPTYRQGCPRSGPQRRR